ncbi:MAG: FAD-binding oxidoreductase [Peptococcaceae bacterium]|jgi:FAD/FMN-containing dehydrogenase|nr:FAD-binding oxidoreductase [Peptococcaceae bacterium]MDH7525485.1 FAD-binding oxidoreductase [Peptococcaceae bacterium]
MYDLVKQVAGEENFSQDEFELWCYSRDSGSILPRKPEAVVMVRSVEVLTRIMELAYRYNKRVIARGAASSMCGAAMPLEKETLIMDMTTLQGIEMDEYSMIVSAGAGVTWTQLNKYLQEKGLELGLEGPWSAPSATIGGTLAVHAICMGSAKYGSLGTQVTGLEVVLPDGTLLRTGSGAHPANTMVMRDCNGADLTGLFLGSHGTLGIITKAAMKVYPLTKAYAYGAFSFASLDQAISAMSDLAVEELVYDSRLFVYPVPYEIGGNAGVVYMIKSRNPEWLQDMMGKARDLCLQSGGKEIKGFGEEYYKGRNHARVKAFGKAGPGWLEVAGFVPILKYSQVVQPILDYFRRNAELLQEYNIKWSLGGLLETRCINVPVALFCNERNKDSWEKMLKILMELADVMFAEGISPYWIGDLSRFIMWRLGPTYDLYKSIKSKLDPKNILNPGIL